MTKGDGVTLIRCVRIDKMQGIEGEGDRSLLP